MEDKRTKIVATIGPASSSVTMLTRMMHAGMNVCRLNFSHGTHVEHKALVKNIRAASKRAERPIAILQDLQGPKMRVGNLPESGIDLKKGMTVKFNTSVKEYAADGPIPVTYKQLHKDVKKGHRILLNDGLIELTTTSVRGRSISAKVTVGGQLTSHKGMNLPDSTVSVSSFTEKDREDLLFGLEQGVDWVALSFVTSPDVVVKVKQLIQAKCRTLGTPAPKVLVKIERAEAVERFAEILDACDGVMLARGDLGIEIPFEEVPIVQKEFIEVCRQTGKPIIVATHMLDSMTEHARATRAEISDVANAVIDHADAVMLSQESAVGEYPYLAVHTMDVVIKEAEASRLDDISFYSVHDMPDVPTTVAQSLLVMTENDQIDVIVSAVEFGEVAQKINVFRPNAPIILACPNISVARQMTLRAGIYPIVMNVEPATFVMRMERKLREKKMIKSSQRVAYVTSASNGQVQLTIR